MNSQPLPTLPLVLICGRVPIHLRLWHTVSRHRSNRGNQSNQSKPYGAVSLSKDVAGPGSVMHLKTWGFFCFVLFFLTSSVWRGHVHTKVCMWRSEDIGVSPRLPPRRSWGLNSRGQAPQQYLCRILHRAPMMGLLSTALHQCSPDNPINSLVH